MILGVTVGPAIRTAEMLRAALARGANGFRFSASKEPPEQLCEAARALRAMSEESIEIWLDLPGSKTRLTNEGGFELASVKRIRLDFSPTPPQRFGDTAHLGTLGQLPRLEVGDRLLIGDGEDAMEVTDAGAGHVMCRPLTSGILGHKRGVVVDGKTTRHTSLTESDVAALRTAAGPPFTGVIVSFVEEVATVSRVRELIRAEGGTTRVVAKVETRRGAENITEIAAIADAVLLGRGDLLLDVGVLDFDDVQERVIASTQAARRPLIVGTDLLSSLSDNWLPNRSELSYLTQLIKRGVEGVLLARETTVGGQPLRAIELIRMLQSRHGR